MTDNRQQSGLRDLPLSQYLLRGMSSNAASQYQVLRRLQEEQATVVPLRCGPFRVFVSERLREVLQAAGMDRSGLVSAFRHGFDVQRIEPADGDGVGHIVGSVDGGRVRIVLAHEPDLPAPADWRLIRLDRGEKQEATIATLAATWAAASSRGSDTVAGNAHVTLSQCHHIQNSYLDWVATWEPPTVSAPFLIFHLDRALPKNTAVDRLFNGMRQGTALFACQRDLQFTAAGREMTLTFHVPEFQTVLTARQPRFADTGPNEWLVTNLEDAPADLAHVASVDVRCYIFTRKIREQWRGVADAEAWLEVLRDYEARYADRRLTGWTSQAIAGGPFNLWVSGRARDDLEGENLNADALCAAMTRSLTVIGYGREEIIAATDISGFRIHLAPHQPLIGVSDWALVDARRVEQPISAFARVIADWEEGRRGQPALCGNAATLLQELAVIQTRRHGRESEIRQAERSASGDTPELAERIRAWQRVCELERDLFQVGVTRMERSGQEYLLVPEDQEAVEEWIDGLESLNQEGVDWNRYPLELRAHEQHARLTVRSVRATDEDDGEIILTVGCDNMLGRGLADAICDGQVDEQIRLFLPDTQLRLIDSALEILDPQRQTWAERHGVAGRDLMPDDQSLQTLQSILTGAKGLAAKRGDWPPLPVPPLAALSPAQEEAVRAAIFGPDMTLIQGPPGTGKTTIILEILRQLFRLHGKSRRFKVLLVAPTHVAVDNVLERLVAPRRGTSLVAELGVAPYRIGSTRRIAERLRGFTPDCINTDYLRQIERGVAESIQGVRQKAALDRGMISALAVGTDHEAMAWRHALETGELPMDDWHPSWPIGLDADWQERIATPSGRLEAWRHWNTHGNNPERRAALLERWLDFLRHSPRFFSELLVANANLVCGTTIGCATHRELRAASYDYVIVDEAGKEEARRLLVPLIRGERWVLVGDHQQLPPYADDDLKEQLALEGLDPQIITRSLFEELQGQFEERGCYVFLDRQGRMHPDISAFVSQRFYEGKLHDFPHAVHHTLPRPRFLPDDPKLLVLDTRRIPQRHEKRRGTGFVNLLEQDITLFLLQAFAGLDDWQEPLSDDRLKDMPSIGVIAPYRLQVEDLARRARKDRVLKRLLHEGLLHIGTVDSFQGQERDLIVFTCTRSNPQGRLGFVDNRQRLNVALSRARSRLVVILDGDGVERSCREGELSGAEVETRDHLHALLTFCRHREGVLEVPVDWQQCWRR